MDYQTGVSRGHHRRVLVALLAAAPIGCAADGVLGSPCAVGSDCDDGLMCDLHDGGGSCQRPHLDDEPMPAPGGCEVEHRDDAYALGLTKHGAWSQVAFVDALPAPPSRGDNTWTMEVRDGTGAALTDLEIVVDPFMPDHAHGTTIRCDVSETDVPGRYLLEPVNLFMPGLWEVTLALRGAQGEDEVVFRFCIDP